MADDPDKIAVGDVVRVKHIIGPKMLVTDISQDGRVGVLWFNRRLDAQSRAFLATQLFKCLPDRFSAAAEPAADTGEAG